MLGYNTVFYDIRTKHWYWDEINQRVATRYIKLSDAHFEYIQPLRPDNDDMTIIKDDKIIIPRGKVFLSSQVLEGIVKYIIPLYIRVILKG